MKNKLVSFVREFWKVVWVLFKYFFFIFILPACLIMLVLFWLMFYSFDSMHDVYTTDNDIAPILGLDQFPEWVNNIKCQNYCWTDYCLECLFDITNKNFESEFVKTIEQSNFKSYSCSWVKSEETEVLELFDNVNFAYDTCYWSGYTNMKLFLSKDRTMWWFKVFIE